MWMVRAYIAYTKLTGKQPLLLESVQTGLIFAKGDLIAQTISKPSEDEYNFERTGTLFIVGLMVGPLMRKWHKNLDLYFGDNRKMNTVMKKFAVDQFILTPIILVLLIAYVSVAEVESLEDMPQVLSNRERKERILQSCKMWPLVQMVTFALPPNFRVLFQQTAAQGLNVYDSYKHKKPEGAQQVKNKNKYKPPV
nr:mpv17-like protein 2 [Halyomorpha halys]